MKDVFPLTILSNILCPKQKYCPGAKYAGTKRFSLNAAKAEKD